MTICDFRKGLIPVAVSRTMVAMRREMISALSVKAGKSKDVDAGNF